MPINSFISFTELKSISLSPENVLPIPPQNHRTPRSIVLRCPIVDPLSPAFSPWCSLPCNRQSFILHTEELQVRLLPRVRIWTIAQFLNPKSFYHTVIRLSSIFSSITPSFYHPHPLTPPRPDRLTPLHIPPPCQLPWIRAVQAN